MKYLIFLIGSYAMSGAMSGYGTGSECSGEYMSITKKLLKGFYYDNAVRVPVVKHDQELLIEEFHFVLYKMPKYHFGIDASALPKNGVIKIYKEGKKKTRTKVYDSRDESNPEEIHHEPEMDSRKYIVSVEIPEGADPGCITIALGYSLKNENQIGTTTAKPRVKVVD